MMTTIAMDPSHLIVAGAKSDDHLDT